MPQPAAILTDRQAGSAPADLATLPPFETPAPAPGHHEIHVYFGNSCNRACVFCTVEGRPGGWYGGIDETSARHATAYAGSRGVIKIYGGEPTMYHRDVRAFMAEVRRLGFAGPIVIFSNGVQARRLIDLLDGDVDARAVLNFSIATGRFAPICPVGARRRLLAYAAQWPDRLFLSHTGIRRYAQLDTAGPEAECARCAPAIVTGDASFVHACPFAAEQDAPHYRLGPADAPAAALQANHAAFLRWVDDVLHPAAHRQQLHPCQMCATRIDTLPLPHFAAMAGGGTAGS